MSKIYVLFKMLIVNSYGRRSQDGANFIKKEEWTEEFLNSPAYEALFMWLMTDPDNATAFYDGILPQKVLDQLQEIESKKSTESGEKPKIDQLSREELVKMIQSRASGTENATS